MSLSDLKDFVSKVSPTIGLALSGPLGGLAGVAISLLSKTFGADLDPDKILSNLKEDQDYEIKLKQLEEQHFSNLIQSTENARNLEKTFLEKTGHGNYMLPFLTILLFSSIALIIFCLLKFELQSDIKSILVMIITYLTREIPDIYYLYFGGNNDSGKNK